jgi:hypothetical protein
MLSNAMPHHWLIDQHLPHIDRYIRNFEGTNSLLCAYECDKKGLIKDRIFKRRCKFRLDALIFSTLGFLGNIYFSLVC